MSVYSSDFSVHLRLLIYGPFPKLTLVSNNSVIYRPLHYLSLFIVLGITVLNLGNSLHLMTTLSSLAHYLSSRMYKLSLRLIISRHVPKESVITFDDFMFLAHAILIK